MGSAEYSTLPSSPAPFVDTFVGDTVHYVAAAAGEFIPFSFKNPDANGGVVPNGSTADPDYGLDTVTNIYAYVTKSVNGAGKTILTLTTTPQDWFIAAFDDSGAGPDDNHDDYIVLGRVTPVPLPPAMLLFGTGLAGLGYLSRRRRKTAAAA